METGRRDICPSGTSCNCFGRLRHLVPDRNKTNRTSPLKIDQNCVNIFDNGCHLNWSLVPSDESFSEPVAISLEQTFLSKCYHTHEGECNINVIATYKPSYAIPFAEKYTQGIRLRIHLLFHGYLLPLPVVTPHCLALHRGAIRPPPTTNCKRCCGIIRWLP